MKSKNPFMIGAVFTLTPFIALAQGGSNAGNGGNAVICFDKAHQHLAAELAADSAKVGNTIPREYTPFIKSVEAVDLYEAREPYRNEPKGEKITPRIVRMRADETPEGFIDRLIEQHELISLNMPYGTYPLSHFFSDAQKTGLNYELFAPSITVADLLKIGKKAIQKIKETPNGVPPARDISPLQLTPTGCLYSTIAIQRAAGVPGVRHLTIDSKIFTEIGKQEEISKAVFYLHEYILAGVLALRPMDQQNIFTEGVRELVGHLISAESTYYDLVDTIRRWDLYPRQIQFSTAYVIPTSIYSQMLDTRAHANQVAGTVVSNLEPQFQTETQPIYQRLNREEKAYLKNYSLKTNYEQNPGHYYFGQRFANARREIQALRDQYFSQRIPNTIHQVLSGLSDLRRTNMEKGIAPYEADSRMNAAVLHSLKNTLIEAAQDPDVEGTTLITDEYAVFLGSRDKNLYGRWDEKSVLNDFEAPRGYSSYQIYDPQHFASKVYITFVGIDPSKIKLNREEFFQE